MRKINCAPQNTQEWYKRGYQLMLEERYSESITAYTKAIEHDAKCAKAHFGRGACHYKLGHYHQAEDDIKAAALLGCEDELFWTN